MILYKRILLVPYSLPNSQKKLVYTGETLAGEPFAFSSHFCEITPPRKQQESKFAKTIPTRNKANFVDFISIRENTPVMSFAKVYLIGKNKSEFYLVGCKKSRGKFWLGKNLVTTPKIWSLFPRLFFPDKVCVSTISCENDDVSLYSNTNLDFLT